MVAQDGMALKMAGCGGHGSIEEGDRAVVDRQREGWVSIHPASSAPEV